MTSTPCRPRGLPESRMPLSSQRPLASTVSTQDLDFSDVRRFQPGTHAGVVLLRLRTRGRAALLRRVEQVASRPDFPTWSGCLVIVTDLKVRVRRPPPS